MGFTQSPACGGRDRGPARVRVRGRDPAGSSVVSCPAAGSPRGLCWHVCSAPRSSLHEQSGDLHSFTFRAVMQEKRKSLLFPWQLVRGTLAGARQQDAVSPSDFSKPHQRKASTPMLPQAPLVPWGLWCICFQKCSSPFLVITSLLHSSAHTAASFWFSLLSADSHCTALQVYSFRSCWGWHGQMQIVLGDWWPVRNGLGGSILSQAGRYRLPKWCQHQWLPLAALFKGHRD